MTAGRGQRYLAAFRSVWQARHERCPSGPVRVFSSVNSWPRLHSVLRALPLSRALARLVRSRRWAGLQHARLRQRWSTVRPSGIGPCARIHATRCAVVIAERPPGMLHPTWPYPWLPRLSLHGQQSPHPRITTRDQMSATTRSGTGCWVGARTPLKTAQSRLAPCRRVVRRPQTCEPARPVAPTRPSRPCSSWPSPRRRRRSTP